MKKFAILVILTGIHFALSICVVPVTVNMAGGGPFQPAGPTTAVHLMVMVTSLLHFPVITLGLYSRHWFPGNWIYIPIFVNSLIWGVVACGLFYVGKKIRNRV